MRLWVKLLNFWMVQSLLIAGVLFYYERNNIVSILPVLLLVFHIMTTITIMVHVFVLQDKENKYMEDG